MSKANPVLPLVEHFFSVQGEGANAGRAAFFVRFAGCNLDCVFANDSRCDTPWQKAREKIHLDDLIGWILEQTSLAMNLDWADLRDTPKEHKPIVILTGGEPTMAVAFDALVQALSGVGFFVAVESNGTIWRDSLTMVDWLVVSPKTDIGQDKPKASPKVDKRVMRFADEWRYVIAGIDAPKPPFYDNGDLHPAKHYVSPALEADGLGTEIITGITPKFVPGAVERCIEIVQNDPRWRISLQTHKWMLVR